MFMSITDFQELVTVRIWMFNNLLLNKSCGMLRYIAYVTAKKVANS